MPQPLAIVGASVRAAAASAVRAGFQPVTADLFADLDLRRIATATRISPYPEGLLDWLRTIEPPAWMYTGALENHPELVDQMAWIAPLWGNPGDVLAEVRDPLLLQSALCEAGLLFPETRTTSEGLPRDGSWLVKNYRGASGSGVRTLGSRGQGAGSRELETSAPHCFQKRIAGQSFAGVYIGDGQQAELIGLTRQVVGEPWLRASEFKYAGSIGPCFFIGDAVHSEARRIGQEIGKRFCLSGLFGIDFMINDEQVWTVEVNPRYTASVEVLERVWDLSLILWHAMEFGAMRVEDDLSLQKDRVSSPGQEAPPSLETLHMHNLQMQGKAILYAKRPVVISHRFAEWALDESQAKPWPNLADVSPAQTPIPAGRPVITVFAAGSSDQDVEHKLRQHVADVEAKLYAE